MKRKKVSYVAFMLALVVFPLAAGLSLDKGAIVSGSWLTVLWTAFGVSLVIGLLSLNPVYDRLRAVAGAMGARMTFEVRRREPPAKEVKVPATSTELLQPGQQRAVDSREQAPSDSLKLSLMRERAQGGRLLSGLSPLTQGLLVPRVSQGHVEGWEATVRHVLRNHSDLLKIFNYDPPISPIAGMVRSQTAILLGGSLAMRLRRRLDQLDKVIEGL